MEVAKLRELADMRVQDDLKNEQRKRNLMVLIMHHLQGHGYTDTVARLQTECNLSLKKVTAADNMDLITILQEYETYFGIKFGKTPKLTKKCAGDDVTPSGSSKTKKNTPPVKPKAFGTDELPSYDSESKTIPNLPKLKQGGLVADRHKKKKNDGPVAVKSDSPLQVLSTPTIKQHTEILDNFGVIGTKVKKFLYAQYTDQNIVPAAAEPTGTIINTNQYDSKLLKPLPHYDSFELRELAAIITRDIYQENPNVHWGDIAGLATSKRLVRESVVYPLRFPDASSIVSKWRGDSEKLVRVLFELARYHSPSTIFIDEIEAIMGHRTSDGVEHEGSRRMKTELLIQMDGLSKTTDCVFLLAATNLPWDLDIAMLRRLEKRILIELPDEEARASMFEINLPSTAADVAGNKLVGNVDYKALAKKSEGKLYSVILSALQI
ncbi:UNVERIFIED_CONTAM: Katanin p60 ATPase-containing subunit A-like 2 [Siphonaria sp. JEL0065]|nr:Katanin p60 ATPase-containing subunit A-like 2 [Siphonaria sp. JEL0065]